MEMITATQKNQVKSIGACEVFNIFAQMHKASGCYFTESPMP